ncbi:MAG: glycosyltransferase [Novosphingobium sp.]
MRILFLTSTLPRWPGDQQANFVGEQVAAWSQVRPSDELLIVAPHDKGAQRREVHGKVEVFRFRYRLRIAGKSLAYPAILPNLRESPALILQLPGFLLALFWTAFKAVRQRRIDVIYAHWVVPQGLVAWLVNRLTGVPYVLQNHSSDLAVLAKGGKLRRWLGRKMLLGCTTFFCVNRTQAEVALAMLHPVERADFHRRLVVLPMGVDMGQASADSPFTPVDLGTISRLSRKKGLEQALAAFDLLAARGTICRVAMAGDGEDRARLEALAEPLSVQFPGFLAGERKWAFMQSCKAFFFTSQAVNGDVEGLPVSILEALILGKTAALSRDTMVEHLPEWPEIKDCVAFVADPSDTAALADAFEQVLSQPEELRRAREDRLRAIMSRYLWPRLILEYVDAVETAIAKNATQGRSRESHKTSSV